MRRKIRRRINSRVWTLCAIALVLVASACTGASRPQAEGDLTNEEATETAAPSATGSKKKDAGPKTVAGGPVSRASDTVDAPPAGAPLPKRSEDIKPTGPRLYSGASDMLGIHDDKI